MRGRIKKQPKFEKPKPVASEINFEIHKTLGVHYREGIQAAKTGYKPKWFDEELTEWKCIQRDAYRAGYRTIKQD